MPPSEQGDHARDASGRTLHTRRQVIRTLGKAAYIAPAMTVLSLGSIKAVADTSNCPPGNPGNPGGGNCEGAQSDGKRKRSRNRGD